jgi:type IV pilus assembly protein PilV
MNKISHTHRCHSGFTNPGFPHSGFTLIEVLITVLVVSIGLLGLAGLQISGLRANMGSEARSKATIMANDIAERMHANPLGVDANQYNNITTTSINAVNGNAVSGCNTAPSPFCSNNSSDNISVVSDINGCNATEMAAFDVWVWACGLPVDNGVQRGGVINNLMNGTASINCNDNPCAPGSAHTIIVSWSSLNPNREGDGSEAATLAHNYTLVMVP